MSIIIIIIIVIIIIITIILVVVVVIAIVIVCHVITVRSRGCPITGVRFELFVIGHLQWDTHVIFTSITRALIASLAMLSTVFKSRKSPKDVFAQKKFLDYIFNFEICYRYD